jgi:hypothetical protein
MKYIGNFINWIDEQHIIEHLTACQGDRTPVWQPDRWKGNPISSSLKEELLNLTGTVTID